MIMGDPYSLEIGFLEKIEMKNKIYKCSSFPGLQEPGLILDSVTTSPKLTICYLFSFL